MGSDLTMQFNERRHWQSQWHLAPRRNTIANTPNRTEQKLLNAIMPASTRSLPGTTVIALVASKATRKSPHRYQQIEDRDFIAFRCCPTVGTNDDALNEADDV